MFHLDSTFIIQTLDEVLLRPNDTIQDRRRNRDILLFKGRPRPFLRRAAFSPAQPQATTAVLWERCVRGGGIQRQSICCAGLACLSRSSNQTAEKDQKDQMNQLPAPRREMLDCTTCPSYFEFRGGGPANSDQNMDLPPRRPSKPEFRSWMIPLRERSSV